MFSTQNILKKPIFQALQRWFKWHTIQEAMSETVDRLWLDQNYKDERTSRD